MSRGILAGPGALRAIQAEATASNPSGATVYSGTPNSLKAHDGAVFQIGSSLGVNLAMYDFGRMRWINTLSLNSLYAISTSDGVTPAAIQVSLYLGNQAGSFGGAINTTQTHGFSTSGVSGDEVYSTVADSGTITVNGFARFVLAQHSNGGASVYLQADSLLVNGR